MCFTLIKASFTSIKASFTLFKAGFPRNTLFHVLAIAALGMASYSNTLEGPFQMDGTVLIENNPIVKDLGHIANPSSAS